MVDNEINRINERIEAEKEKLNGDFLSLHRLFREVEELAKAKLREQRIAKENAKLTTFSI